MAGVVRRPAKFNTGGEPDVAEAGVVAPVAVFVEIFIADDVAREIARRQRIVVAAIAAVRPVIELVVAANILKVGPQRIGTAEHATLTAVERVGLAAAGGLASAVAHADGGVGAVVAGFDAVDARLVHRKRQVRCIDFEVIVLIEAAHMNVDRARG